MDTVVIVDGRRDDPQARTLVFHLPRDGHIIDALCHEQRIYCCGSSQVIEDGCGDDVYHLQESEAWQTNDWWQELQTRIVTLECMRAYYGLTIEQDLDFEPCRLSTVKQPEQGG